VGRAGAPGPYAAPEAPPSAGWDGAALLQAVQPLLKRDVINRKRKCHKWRVVGFSLAAKE